MAGLLWQRWAGSMTFERESWMLPALISLGYLTAYVLLDWASFIDPLAPIGITPWKPQTGLSFALVLLFGRRFLPMLFVAPLLGNFATRSMWIPLPVEFLEVLIVGSGYAAASLLLLRPAFRFDTRLMAMRDLVLLLGLAISSAAVVATACVTMFAGWGMLSWGDWPRAVLRLWIGDVIGITVVTPFLLFMSTRHRPSKPTWEAMCQFLAIFLALWMVFAVAQPNQFQLFYVIFLPIVWIAIRTGIEGVSTGIVVTQLGLIMAMRYSPHSNIDVTSFQAVMLVLALTGLVAGMLVSERRRAELDLRRQQDALAHVARLGNMGELAAAIAHEINQPLTATGIYTRLVRDSLKSGTQDAATTIEAADKAVAQVDRAAEVVRRLRELVRLGRSEVVQVSVQRIVQEAVDHFQFELDKRGVVARVVLPRNLPPVMADMLQIEQVLLNLLRNAVEAMVGDGYKKGKVTIETVIGISGYVEFRVRDTGPGFSAEIADGALLPFATTKPEGLGMGLSLSRTIIESHGGKLWISGGPTGAVVHFTLPIAESSDHDRQ